MDNKTIGLLISTKRKEKGLTQKALADQLNVTDKAVSKWERDVAKPDINTIPKLAEILDLSIEELMNLPVKPKVESIAEPVEKVAEENQQKEAEMAAPESDDIELVYYKEQARKLLIKGIIGFVAGAIFTFIMEKELVLGQAAVVGFFLAGVPYGWELVGKITGDWMVIGHIVVMLIYYAIRMVASVLIGWIVYPIALAYNLMKAQKVGSVGRYILTAVFVIIILLVVGFALLLFRPWQ